MTKSVAELRVELEEARARIAELESALKPFADIAQKVEDFISDRVANGGSTKMNMTDLRAADFERAAATLKGEGNA